MDNMEIVRPHGRRGKCRRVGDACLPVRQEIIFGNKFAIDGTNVGGSDYKCNSLTIF